jgi:hypothetical protein
MLQITCVCFLVLASIGAVAETRKHVEVSQVLLAEGSLSTEERERLARLLQGARQKCIVPPDLVVAIEQVVDGQQGAGRAQSTRAIGSYFVDRGVNPAAVYEGQTTLDQVRARRANGASCLPAIVGAIYVELVCTSKE